MSLASPDQQCVVFYTRLWFFNKTICKHGAQHIKTGHRKSVWIPASVYNQDAERRQNTSFGLVPLKHLLIIAALLKQWPCIAGSMHSPNVTFCLRPLTPRPPSLPHPFKQDDRKTKKVPFTLGIYCVLPCWQSERICLLKWKENKREEEQVASPLKSLQPSHWLIFRLSS